MPGISKVRYWKEKLKLSPHPEGGHFAESWRSEESISKEALPYRYPGERTLSTSIYFLLEKGDISAFHRILSDEIWYFHDGDPFEIVVIGKDGALSRYLLGVDEKSQPQLIVPHGCWFASRTTGLFSLAGCNVAPGFDFEDFELATFNQLSAQFPEHEKVIREFTL